MTHNSLAVNNGNNCVITANGCGDGNPAIPTDQRGAARVGNVDIGAFEVNSAANGGSFRAVTLNGKSDTPFFYQLTPDSGAFSYSVTAGSLPPGLYLSNSLSVNSESGRLSAKKSLAPAAGAYSITGTPTMGGIFDYTITATNGTDSVSTDYTTTIQAAPTSAPIEISGRVLSGNNRGISNAQVTLTDQYGQTQTARTTTFGYFRFTDVQAGADYVIGVSAKQYSFAPQIITPQDNMTDLIFSSAD